MVNSYPRESVEFQPVKVTLEGAPVTSGLLIAVVPDGQRPVTFTPAIVFGPEAGVMVSGLAHGTYRIFAQLESGPETPVVDCGHFYIE